MDKVVFSYLSMFNCLTHSTLLPQTQMFTLRITNLTFFCKIGRNAEVLNMFRKCGQNCVQYDVSKHTIYSVYTVQLECLLLFLMLKVLSNFDVVRKL